MGKKEDKDSSENNATAIGVGVFIGILWFLIGLVWAASLITSLVCIGKSGTAAEKAIGVILAFLLGPLFFFVYLYFNKAYCRSKSPNIRSN